MNTSVNLMLILLVILCLSFSASGCKSQIESGTGGSVCRPWSDICALGYENALKYRDREIPAYKLVITLSTLSGQERIEFLQGFKKAYNDAYDGPVGQEYADILKRSLEGGYYEQAIEQGKKYVIGEITDARIQELISNSVGLSRGSDLGWKAGYIAGFAQEMVKKMPRFDEEHFYQQAETKYNALRGPLGV
jgi:hypothetical protein